MKKIIFFGSSDFAVPSLQALVRRGFAISFVVTQPDRKKGRHLHLGVPAVKTAAENLALAILQPEKLSDSHCIAQIKAAEPDLLVVASYGKIISKQILAIPKTFALNVHGSLLPQYRGAAPIPWALINGEQKTGVTIMKMNERIDEGDIIAQSAIDIAHADIAGTLSDKLSHLGAELLIETIDAIRDKKFSLTPQDNRKASYAAKLKKADGLINWDQPAAAIHNRVRGLLPWPGAFTHYKGKVLKLWKTAACPLDIPIVRAGTVIAVTKDALVVAAAEGGVRIEEVQLESGRRMPVSDFIAGHKVSIGDRFSY